MACSCQDNSEAMLIPPELAMADQGSLMLFIHGVQVGLQIRQAEQQKWTRISVIAALSFGALAFFRWYTGDGS